VPLADNNLRPLPTRRGRLLITVFPLICQKNFCRN